MVTPLMITAVCHLKPQVWTPRWKVQNSHLVKCSSKVSAADIKAYSSAWSGSCGVSFSNQVENDDNDGDENWCG